MVDGVPVESRQQYRESLQAELDAPLGEAVSDDDEQEQRSTDPSAWAGMAEIEQMQRQRDAMMGGGFGSVGEVDRR